MMGGKTIAQLIAFSRCRNVAISLEALRKDVDDEKVTVQNNTNDIGQLKQELSRVQSKWFFTILTISSHHFNIKFCSLVLLYIHIYRGEWG
jgi:hypothetical protein